MDRSMHRARARLWTLATALLASMAPNVPAAASAPPAGGGPGDAIVDPSTGAAQLAIPIAVPPGPGGFAPALALSYSSRAGDGPFGVGWTLGLPEIRCAARFGVPDFAACPHYELGDMLLLRDAATPGSYHTAVESFHRIRRWTSAGGLADWWTVRPPDGTKLTFGQSGSHRVRQDGHPARWLLERVVDAFGNPIVFAYESGPASAEEPRVASVRYGRDLRPGAREIRFLYEPRPDARLVFAGGVERRLSHRLREIQVISNGGIYRRYVVGYDLAGVSHATDRSRLAWVQEFGADCSADDPIRDCAGQGLPPRTFRYRDASDVGSGAYSQSTNEPAYRIPFGDYASSAVPLWRNNFPELIGDVNGDGLSDRVEVVIGTIAEPAWDVRVWINTGAGFHGRSDSGPWGDAARQYWESLRSLTYTVPRWEYKQIPATLQTAVSYDLWDGSMFAMCEVALTSREANLAQEQLGRGAGARTSSLAALRASGGAPSAGFFEPVPSFEMADLDADGLADLVVSLRLGGLTRHYDCNGARLAEPEHFPAQMLSVVFRNTGSGWENDEAARELAAGLPPFEEVLAKSTYQTEIDEPAQYLLHFVAEGQEYPESPCANLGIWGFEQYYLPRDDREEFLTAVCHNFIDLAPQFADFDGDGHPDLAVLERDDPRSFWSGGDPEYPHALNAVRTRVWLQRPGQSPRWQRAPQYDLPLDTWPIGWQPPYAAWMANGFAHAGLVHLAAGPGSICVSWQLDFPSCSPNTYRYDNGVRLADLNRDGLVDVVWSFEGQEGVFLNRGSTAPEHASSAWCASEADDAPLVGGACPEAAALRPPAPLSTAAGRLGQTSGLLGDLNGDGFADFVALDLVPRASRDFMSWIHDPAAPSASVWRRDARFDFHLECVNCQVQHPASGAWIYVDRFYPRYAALDVDGDGADDVVGDTDAFLSRSRHADLVREIDNGRGGSLSLEYASPARQRAPALEAEAEQAPSADEAGLVALWRPDAVVTRVTAVGPNLAPPGAITAYAYAHPRSDPALRVDLGFGLALTTRPGGAEVWEHFHQDPGRTGRTARRLVKEAGRVVHRYEAAWEPVSAVIPGSIAGVRVARLVSERSWNEYGGVPGAIFARSIRYDDAYGFNFVAQVHTQRPSSDTVESFDPWPVDASAWIAGLVRERRVEDRRSSWTSRTELTYTAEGRVESELRHRARGDGSEPAADLTRYFYDESGNVARKIDANGRVTQFGYDESGSALTSRTDPGLDGGSGKVSVFDPHPVFGVPIAVDPGYRDIPRTEMTLDPFGRVVETWVVPRDQAGVGEPVLVSAASFADHARPPYIERFRYTSPERDATRTVEVDDGFGGVWKTVRDAGPIAGGGFRFVGSATYHDPARRVSRTTHDLPCGARPSGEPDDLCAGLTGATETPATVQTVDALARPVRIETPRGAALSHYTMQIEQILEGSARNVYAVDVAWFQNARGDLTRRSLDGDRVLAVEECTNSDPGRASLEGAVCARDGGPNRTLYGYHASGSLALVLDPLGVAGAASSARHRLAYHFDTAGQLVAVDDPDAGHSEIHYDGVGNAVKRVNARGQERITEFDALGRAARLVSPEGEVRFSYRPEEMQLRSESGPGYAKSFVYDGFGRVAVERMGGFQVGQARFTTYDLQGRPTAITATGVTIQYEYDGGFLARVCARSSRGACSDASATPILAEIGYDELGRRSAVQLPGGSRTFEYAAGDARDLRADAFVGASTVRHEYLARDGLGNLLGWSTAASPGLSASGSYSYDARNRLASWTRAAAGEAEVAESFRYDALGNRTLHGAAEQVFDHPDKPHAMTRRGDESWAYDASGNVARAGGRHFEFDSANRLVCAGSAASQCDLLRVVYDADGRKIYERAGGTRRGFLGPDQVRTITATGAEELRLDVRAFGERVGYTVNRRSTSLGSLEAVPFEVPPWIFDLVLLAALTGAAGLAIRGGVLAALARRPGRATVAAALVAATAVPSPALAMEWGWERSYRWVLSDALGSGVALLDENGTLLAHTRFAPFGGVDGGYGAAAGELDPRRHFAGHAQQRETGLYYMNARWMDPETGMFLSVDPVVADAADPQSYAAYGYARNNPVNRTDPTGAFADPFEELQKCNRCSGFAWAPGFYMGPNGTGWITTMADFAKVEGQLADLRSAVYGTPAAATVVPLGPLSVLAAFALFLKSVVDFLVGEDFGRAWVRMFAEPWLRGPTGGLLPPSLSETVESAHSKIPEDANANGMHAWHAGSNAGLAKQLGLIGAPLILLAGLLHETPIDTQSFLAEQHYQGSLNHALDSATDIAANAFGLVIGYLVPRGDAGMSIAIELGNYIPGPGEPDPAFGGAGAYTGSPSAAWGQYP